MLRFEATNDRAFIPSSGPSSGYAQDGAANLIQTSVSSGTNPQLIEVALDLTTFTQNALNVPGYRGLPSGKTANGIVMTNSQSFGYGFVGGTADYGPAYLRFVTIPVAAVPEPASLVLMAWAWPGWLPGRGAARAKP